MGSVAVVKAARADPPLSPTPLHCSHLVLRHWIIGCTTGSWDVQLDHGTYNWIIECTTGSCDVIAFEPEFCLCKTNTCSNCIACSQYSAVGGTVVGTVVGTTQKRRGLLLHHQSPLNGQKQVPFYVAICFTSAFAFILLTHVSMLYFLCAILILIHLMTVAITIHIMEMVYGRCIILLHMMNVNVCHR